MNERKKKGRRDRKKQGGYKGRRERGKVRERGVKLRKEGEGANEERRDVERRMEGKEGR